jgi:uncharacterized peroxidase-related enzyme
MAFIDIPADDEVDDETRAMYDRQSAPCGYVPNYARAFCHRPHVMSLWAQLQAGIRRDMDKRRFEIVTFAAAHALRSTLCTVAHGRKLATLIPEEDVLAIARGERPGTLSAAEVAIVAFARKVARDAAGVTSADVAALRKLGLSDAEVFDVAATSAARAFWTKVLDALGVEADPAMRDEVDPGFASALSVGRPLDFDSRAGAALFEVADQPVHHDENAEREIEPEQRPQRH